jgi:hypothetical protein
VSPKPDTKRFRDQAARYDRIADQCVIPELVPYYRKLADDFRQRAADELYSSDQDDLDRPLEGQNAE